MATESGPVASEDFRARGGLKLGEHAHPATHFCFPLEGWLVVGEALLATGRREEGLDAHRRAFELDPDVGRAAEVLERAGRHPPSEPEAPPP